MNTAQPAARSGTVHVVGAGAMGLLAAIELRVTGQKLGLEFSVRVHESGALGGCRRSAATPRCQQWLHCEGVIYASTQPGVSLALQRSTARLCELLPESIRRPLALAVDTGEGPAASEFFRALGVWHEPVAPDVVHAWLPGLRLPAGSRIYRTRDCTLDLTLAVHELTVRARGLGVAFESGRVTALEERGGRIRALRMDRGGLIQLGADDAVVLATGVGTRGLLAASGLTLPGLRVFRSTLVAARTGIPALIAFLRGGVNVVPHELPDGSHFNVLGDSRRREVLPDEDGLDFDAEAADVEDLCADVATRTGVVIPSSERRAWVGLKAEVVPPGEVRSQADHVLTLEEARNLWIAIPGKLSQAAGTARTLVQRIARARCEPSLARPVWECAPVGVAAFPGEVLVGGSHRAALGSQPTDRGSTPSSVACGGSVALGSRPRRPASHANASVSHAEA